VCKTIKDKRNNILPGKAHLEGIVSVLSSPFNVMLKLLEIIKKYQKKKKTESLLISALEKEIRTYLDIYERTASLSEDKIMPILQSVGNEPTPHDMNKILEAMSPMPIIHAEWSKHS